MFYLAMTLEDYSINNVKFFAWSTKNNFIGNIMNLIQYSLYWTISVSNSAFPKEQRTVSNNTII